LNSPSEARLEIEGLTFCYHSRQEPAIQDISFDLQPGEVMLLAGASGCGKTTLMRCINGLIPKIYRGSLEGQIRVYGRPVSEMSMAELSQSVGTLLQDPERQIVGSYVLNEVAFGLENLGLPRGEIMERVERTLDYLGIAHLRDREVFNISGGEKQKIALAGILVMEPRILLLDEPLASLDPASSSGALQLFRRLADDGISVLLVEHRVDEVLAIQPERVLYLEDGKAVYLGDPQGMLDVVDYRRVKLPARTVVRRARNAEPPPEFQPALPPPTQQPLIDFQKVGFRYRPELPETLRGVNLQVHPGDVIAVLGANGAGKTTLVKHALGLLKPTRGQVLLEGQDTRKLTVAQAAHTIGYVFQSPTQMLYAPTVEEELAFGPRNLAHPPEQIRADVSWAIRTVHLEPELKTPPLALSFGQQKRVSIAAVLAMRSRILMMDEPTAGQDYWNYRSFMDTILQMPGFEAILFITHDVDLAVIYANRILLIYNGQVAADGSPHAVLRDEEKLRACRVLPTSLLELNLELYPQTGRFLRAEALAQYVA
jgi:energy-coupling factor transport system ATP-binding protein